METERITILEIYKKNGKVFFETGPDFSKYEVYGVLSAFTDVVEKDLKSNIRKDTGIGGFL